MIRNESYRTRFTRTASSATGNNMTNNLKIGTDLSKFCRHNNYAFLCLGVNHDKCMFYSSQSDTVVSFRFREKLRVEMMPRLAPMEWFKEHYSTHDKRCRFGVRWTEVINDLLQQSYKVGKYEGIMSFDNALPPLISYEIPVAPVEVQ